MKKFIIRIVVFLILGYIVGEVVIRSNKLTSDHPERYIDDNGIQHYLPNQKGYYYRSDFQWSTNKYGWLGVCDFENKDYKISVIGDSYIEDMINPDSCNQGYVLQNNFKDFGFFEIGRSGITFIETMEIAKDLDNKGFNKHLIYVSDDDFVESISKTTRYTDRLQIDIDSSKILPAEIRAPGLKKVLYNTKFLYYLYTRYPIFVSAQNKGEINLEKIDVFTNDDFKQLFDYCANHYQIKKITLVFHPNTSQTLIDLAKEYGFDTIELIVKGDKTWAFSESEAHWSCYGQSEIAKQVTVYLNDNLPK